MKKMISIVAACLTVGLAAQVKSNAQTSDAYPSYIEVNASAEKEVAPDVFYLRIDIDEVDSKGRKSIDDQQKTMIQALKAMGVNTEKQLTRLSLSSAYYNKKTNIAKASYQLKLTSAEELSKAWAKLDAMGLSNIAFLKAEYSKIDELKDQVRRDATVNAKAQAASMAQAIGQNIGKCFYINGGYASIPVVYAQPRMMTKTMMYDASNELAEEESIEFNNIKVTANITARFILE